MLEDMYLIIMAHVMKWIMFETHCVLHNSSNTVCELHQDH
jgi:hypothetical protein